LASARSSPKIEGMRYALLFGFACFVVAGIVASCGGRSELRAPYRGVAGEGAGAMGGSGVGGATGGEGAGGAMACLPGETLVCGTDTGECTEGLRICEDGLFGPCEGSIEPIDELCNDLDDDCDGQIDNGFGLGQPCDGPDSDSCLDDVMSCDGCSLGDDNPEVCNGVDDNCNGTIDADCDFGDCQPGLLVTGSTPSSPDCIDFPVEAGSTGVIQYPCTGGPVSAVLGSIPFSGSVSSSGQLFLSGTEQNIGPDGCLWRMDHYIEGSLPSGTLTYSYTETLLTTPPGNCWWPCTEVGTVEVQW
jgi:hypothetical protein